MRTQSAMIFVLMILSVMLFVPAACGQASATSAQASKAQATAKVVFFYNLPVSIKDCLVQANIQIDGAIVHQLTEWHVWQSDVAPGTHVFSDDSHKDKGLTASSSAGRTYYYALKAETGSFIHSCGNYHIKVFEMRPKEIERATAMLGKPGSDESVPNVAPAGPTATTSTTAAAPPAVAKPTATQRLLIESVPSAADIEVDGSFEGSTPSSLELSPGEHTIVVSKTGYKPWQRKIKLITGEIRLTAELEKNAPAQ